MSNKWVSVSNFAAPLIALALAAAPAGACAQPIRHEGVEGWPLLSSVTVPAHSDILLMSGQVPQPVNPDAPVENWQFGNTREQALSVFRQIEVLLARQDMRMGDVVKLTVFLVGDPKMGGKMDFSGFSEAYSQYFGTERQPNLVARSVVQVSGLAHSGYLVEIEAIASK